MMATNGIGNRGHFAGCYNLLYIFLLFAMIAGGISGAAAPSKEGEEEIQVEVQLRPNTILHIWMRAVKNEKIAPAFLYVIPKRQVVESDNGNISKKKTMTARMRDMFTSSRAKPAPSPKETSQNSSNRMPAAGRVRPIMETWETEFFVFKEMRLNREGTFVLSWRTYSAEVSYAYVYEAETVTVEGIRPAYIRPEARHNPLLRSHSYHLRPPLGWANEPNGFNRANDGLYHLFYQHIPEVNRRFDQISDLGDTLPAMHWGHAVSRDLINWVHLPVFLVARYVKDPQKGDQQPMHEWKQHWFSGSSLPEGQHGLRVFVTNFSSGRPNLGSHMELISEDGIMPTGHEREIADKYPPEFWYKGRKLELNEKNIRDPGVFKGPGGYYYMTLGTEDTEVGGVILLFRTSKPNDLQSEWEYQSVLITDGREDMGNIECPGLTPLGDVENPDTLYVLMYGRERGHVGVIHRERDTLMVLGTFDGQKFTPIADQTLDFAFGSYGHQAFYDPKAKQTIVMGWNAWWNDWDFNSDFFSSQSLPRVLKVAPSRQHILIGPHPNVFRQLVGEQLDKGNQLALGQAMRVPDGMAYIKLWLAPLWQSAGIEGAKKVDIKLQLDHPAYNQLAVRINREGLMLDKEMKKLHGAKDARKLIAAGAQPDIVHVFIDRDSLEVYGEMHVDEGMPRWLGTARLFGNGNLSVESVRLHCNSPFSRAISGGIWRMNVPKTRGLLSQSATDTTSCRVVNALLGVVKSCF